MKLVMPYCHKDYNVAFYAVDVLLRRTNINPEDIVLYGSQRAPRAPKELRKRIGKALQSQRDSTSYPLGPNEMIAAFFGLVMGQDLGDTYFLAEPDGFPTAPDFMERIEAEHTRMNAKVSGSMVDWLQPHHLNGNVVINREFIIENPVLARPVIEAWDVHHAELLHLHGRRNKEVHNARRDLVHYPLSWWWRQTVDGHRPAWVHGFQGFAMWEQIDRGLMDADSR